MIRELDKTTAEQIAAGEVIENPASVVKELVENAIDAGAAKIEVLVEGGGKDLIIVTDNGSGIAYGDLPLAFKRFATSKISSINDLDNLASLGFRGEALPSIAAVAKVKMISREDNALSAGEIELAGGDILKHEETGAPAGTRIEVKDLFYNTPGRKKFLRSSSVETSRISNLISEMALAHPEVAFSLNSSKRKLFSSFGDGKLLHVIGSLYGNETAEAMIELADRKKEEGIEVKGYISAPHLNRSSRRWITLVVNGRLVKNATLVNALERGYADLLPGKRYPLVVLNIFVPPETIDVNVHPAKIEIRFREPEELKRLIFRAVKLALQSTDFNPRWPLLDSGTDIISRKPVEESFFKQAFQFNSRSLENKDLSRNSNYEPNVKVERERNEEVNESSQEVDTCHLIGQFLNSYIIAQMNDNLLLIDQHAAHERVLYHQLEKQEGTANEEKSSQLTLPLTINFPTSWRRSITGWLPLLEEAGFKLESLGEDSYVIRAVPFLLQNNAGETDIYDLIETLISAENMPGKDKREILLKTVACHRSIKAGQKLTSEEMQKLLTDWEMTPRAKHCPHGRPVVISYARTELERNFLRRSKN